MFPFADTVPTKHWSIVTFLLVGINVLVFFWFDNLKPRSQELAAIKLGFIPARVGQLSDPQKVVDVPIRFDVLLPNGMRIPQQEFVRLPADRSQILSSALSCMFMHGSWMHLIGNMWFLLLFGNNVEDRLGHWYFLAFYLVGGLLATLLHWAVDPTSTTPIVGASGAIAAVLGGYAVAYPHARIKTLVMLVVIITVVELPAYVFLIGWFVVQLVQGLGVWQMPLGGNNGGVAWWAHVGGFVAGAAMMFAFIPLLPSDKPEPAHEPPLDYDGLARGEPRAMAPRDPWKDRW